MSIRLEGGGWAGGTGALLSWRPAMPDPSRAHPPGWGTPGSLVPSPQQVQEVESRRALSGRPPATLPARTEMGRWP